MAGSSFGKNFAISSEVADAFVNEMAGDVPPGYVSHMEQLGDGELKQQISDALLHKN